MILRVLWSVLLLSSLWSCGSSSDKSDDTVSSCTAVADATYSSLWTTVFDARCGTCHGASVSGTIGGPDLRTKDAFYANLVGKTTNDYSEWDDANVTLKDCLTTQFIKKSAASQSVVVGIFDATVSLGCTPKPHKDPPQSICISDGSLAALKTWINNGAAQ